MTQSEDYQTLARRGQGLSEALELVAKIEAKVLAGVKWQEADLEEIRSLVRKLEFLSVRFRPELEFVTLFLTKASAMITRLENEGELVREDIVAVGEVSTEIESEIRSVNSRLYLYDRWIDKTDTDLAISIAQLIETIGEIIGIFKYSNSVSMNEHMTELHRQTIIQILSAAIEELKAPAVNAGRFDAITGALKRIGKKTAERQVSRAVDDLLAQAAEQAEGIGSELANLPDISPLF